MVAELITKVNQRWIYLLNTQLVYTESYAVGYC